MKIPKGRNSNFHLLFFPYRDEVSITLNNIVNMYLTVMVYKTGTNSKCGKENVGTGS